MRPLGNDAPEVTPSALVPREATNFEEGDDDRALALELRLSVEDIKLVGGVFAAVAGTLAQTDAEGARDGPKPVKELETSSTSAFEARRESVLAETVVCQIGRWKTTWQCSSITLEGGSVYDVDALCRRAKVKVES